MKTKTIILLAGCLVALGLMFVGCSNEDASSPRTSQAPSSEVAVDHSSHDHDQPSTQLCTKCGEIKGTKECCKLEGKAKCAKCELIKGSPGCCKIKKGSSETISLCSKCGFIKDDKDCCKVEGKTRCAQCGLIKGSPGCCKIPSLEKK